MAVRVVFGLEQKKKNKRKSVINNVKHLCRKYVGKFKFIVIKATLCLENYIFLLINLFWNFNIDSCDPKSQRTL